MAHKVEMLPAYWWMCDACGRDNFERGVVPSLSPADEESVKEQLGVDVLDTGVLLTYPDSVTCAYCQTSFETIGYDLGDGQDTESA